MKNSPNHVVSGHLLIRSVRLPIFLCLSKRKTKEANHKMLTFPLPCTVILHGFVNLLTHSMALAEFDEQHYFCIALVSEDLGFSFVRWRLIRAQLLMTSPQVKSDVSTGWMARRPARRFV